jgi:hypothetical protein
MLNKIIKYSIYIFGCPGRPGGVMSRLSSIQKSMRASQEKSCGAFLFSKAWVSTDLSPCAYGCIRSDEKQKCWQCEPHITTSDLIPSGIREGLSTMQTNTQPIDSARRIKRARNKRQSIRGAVQGHEPKASPSNFPSLRVLLESKQLSS